MGKGGKATGRRTTTPLLSAECQNSQQNIFILRATRDTGVNKKSTNCQQISDKKNFLYFFVFLYNSSILFYYVYIKIFRRDLNG